MKSFRPFAAACLAAISVACSVPASAEAPMTKRSSGTLVSPATAFGQLTGTTHTDGIASSSQRSPEIKALARALSRGGDVTGDALAVRVADWVRKNIETEFRFGLGKGAQGALIDQSGTPFDQAELMVEILREAGQTASYRLGTITLNAQQFGQWSGLFTSVNESTQVPTVSAKGACQLLADGGIPATVNGGSSCASLSGNLSTVTMAHIWVYTGNKAYDPAFSPNVLYARIDVPAALGCGTQSSPTCGTGIATAVTTGSSTGPNYIQNLNAGAVQTYLSARATSLQNQITSTDPTAPVEDIFGGAVIDPKYSPPAASGNHPYQTALQTTWTGEIPDAYRAKFLLSFFGLSATLYADEISSKRLRLVTYRGSSQSNPWIRTTKLFMDASIIATGTSSSTSTSFQTDRISVSVDHPFANNYADETFSISVATDPRNSNGCIQYQNGETCPGYLFAASPLVLQVGNAGGSREAFFAKLMNARKVNEYIINNTEVGIGYQQLEAETLSARYLVQTGQALKLLGAVSAAKVSNLHSVGALFSPDSSSGQLYFNVRHGFLVNTPAANTTDENAVFLAAESVASALEGSVLQQSQDGFESSASVAMLKLANDDGQRIYLANASNISSVSSALTGYSNERKAALAQVAAGGYSLVIPQKGAVGEVDLPGTNTGSAQFNFTGQYFYKMGSAAHVINEEYKGGATLGITDPFKAAMDRAKADDPSFKDKSYYGVDLSSGALNLSPPADLAVGSGETLLEFRRTLSTGSSAEMRCNLFQQWIDQYTFEWYNDCTPAGSRSPETLGGGWNHSLRDNASLSGSGSEGLGVSTALRSAFASAALYSIFDANRTDTFNRKLAAVFATYSLITDFVRNSITLTDGREFIRLPDGKFDPPPSSRGSKLAFTGTIGTPAVGTGTSAVIRNYAGTQISTTEADGTVSIFQPSEGTHCPASLPCYTPTYTADNMAVYALVSRTAPAGSKETREYEIYADTNLGLSRKYVTSASNSFGNTLEINYDTGSLAWTDPPQDGSRLQGTKFINSVSDAYGRSTQFSCSDTFTLLYQCAPNVTDALNGVTKYAYASGDGSYAGSQFPDRILKAWYLPSDGQNPFVRVEYDPILHVAALKDMKNATTSYYIASIGGDRFRVGESKDPLGNVSTVEFDKDGSALRQIDPLGRVVRNVYDNAGRLKRKILPEGGAVEYTYDVRGNQLTECLIAKGRVTWNTQSTLQEQAPQCATGSGDLLTTTFYEGGPTQQATACTNAKTCNRPTYVIDPRGFRTNYAWDTTHGQLTSETSGLAGNGSCAVGSVCPQTTYGYTSYTANGATFYLLTSKTEKLDATNARVTAYAYDAANKYALRSVGVTAGGVTQTTCFTFDGIGNLVSSTEPLGAVSSCP